MTTLRTSPGDRGSVTLLALGMVAVVALALVVAVDATAAFIQRRSLVAVADASALAGAQAIDLPAYYREGAAAATRLEADGVLPRVRAHLARLRGIDGLRLDEASSDGQVVLVRLSAPVSLPFTGEWLAGRMRVESRARLAYRPSEAEPGPYP